MSKYDCAIVYYRPRQGFMAMYTPRYDGKYVYYPKSILWKDLIYYHKTSLKESNTSGLWVGSKNEI